jgi:5-methylcytosine-specific restriction endonuclease McrA
MNAARRPCPRCHRISRGPCQFCATRRDQARGGARQRGYDPAWDGYSRDWLARYPWCGQRLGGQFDATHSRCVQRGLRVRASVTDHIVALADGGALLEPSNHQSLCISCNTTKSIRRQESQHG